MRRTSQPGDTMKRCIKCLCEKPMDEFHKRYQTREDRVSKCKVCANAYSHNHRQENLDRLRASDKVRGSSPERLAAYREHSKTPKGKASRVRANKASNARFPDRAKARTELASAVRTGRVVRWPTCALPECSQKPEAHHPDYSRPLDVVWLCPSHHRQAHALASITNP